MTKEKSKVKKWYLSWWFITLAIIGIIILISLITGNPIVSVEIVHNDTSEYENDDFESENLGAESQLTSADCPETYFDCNGTTKTIHNYRLENNECLGEPQTEYNSFDCGYVAPCNLDTCKLSDSNSCEGTTKVITIYSCDSKLGCTFNIIRDENNTDCGYLIGGKYTLEDVEAIKDIAKACRINLDDCIEESDYALPKIKLGYQALYSYPDGYHRGDSVYLISAFYTPYVNAILWTANKEKVYSEYNDSDLIALLNIDSFWIYIPDIYDSQVFNSRYSIGAFKTIVLKDGKNIYKPTKTEIEINGSNYGRIFTFENYSELYNTPLELVIIGEEGEKSITIDISKYK